MDVLLIHRPKYDDWTFPKGKCREGETDEECALREVEEETGLLCTLGRELAGTSYRDRYGRPKVVRYWAMTAVDGSFVPDAEVDDARWVHLAAAERTLSYARDRDVLAALAEEKP